MAEPTLPEVTPAPDVGDAAGRLAARVQAWQHRHPLARRISTSEVGGLGVVALPYEPGPPGQGKPLFHQPNLLPGLSHRALVAFADQHAVAYRPGAPDWPVREVERADASAEAAPETRYLLTAAIGDIHPRRVLIAPESPALWGMRPWSRERVAGASLALMFLLALGALALMSFLRRPAAAPAPVAASAAAPAPAASRADSAPASTVAAPASAPASPPTVAPGAASKASPSASAAPAAVAIPPPVLPMPHAKGAASAPVAPAASAVASAAPAGTHYALVSSPVKKREAAEATLERVRKLLGPAIGTLQAQVMPSPEGFVVTIWPLPTEADAERLAEVLARRGVPMKWLEF